MRTNIAILSLVVIGVWAAPSRSRAEVPALMPFQGFLTDATGSPIDGSTDVTFALYDVETGGTPLYVQTQTVDVEQGFLNVFIGKADAAFVATIFNRPGVYLGVKINSDAEMSDRTRLATVPYAFYSTRSNTCGDADTVGGMAASAFAPKNPEWTSITNRPAGLNDGDDDTTYAAGNGLALSGTNFTIDSGYTQRRVSATCAAGTSIRAIAQDGTVTCEADTDTTYTGATGVALAGTVFGIDPAYTQRRISGSCPAGSSIRVIAEDGDIACETDTDTNTTYTASTGLDLTGTAFSVDPVYVQRRVSATCAAGTSIRVIAADGTVTCEADTDTDTDTNTTYTGASGVALTSTVFSIDPAYTQRRVSATCPANSSIRVIAQDGTVTCDTDDNDAVSYAANSGVALAGTTFSIDPAYTQRRIIGSCAAGQSIRVIAADGTVTCEADTDTDTNTTYTASTGLGLTGTAFSVDPVYVQRRVSATCAAGSSIRAIAEDGTVTCEADTDTNTAYTAGAGLGLTGAAFSVDTAVIQQRVTATCAGESAIKQVNANGTVVCEDDDNTTYTAGAGLTLTGTQLSIPSGGVGTRELAALPTGSVDIEATLAASQDMSSATTFTPVSQVSCLVNVSVQVLDIGLADVDSATVSVLRAGDVTAVSPHAVLAVPIGTTTMTSTATTSHVFTVATAEATTFGCRVTTGAGADILGGKALCHTSWVCF